MELMSIQSLRNKHLLSYIFDSGNFPNKPHSVVPSSSFQYNKKKSIIVSGAKRNRKENKTDNHSFSVKPDEATGLYPEAVLLKKEVVKEDGRVEPDFADAEEEQLYDFLSLQLESSLNLERMRHYEVVFLIHEDHVDEVDSVVTKVQDFIKEWKGRIYRINNWGLRRLAYKIKKAKNANYILMNFEIEARLINDFKSMLDKDERIIRHLVIKRDEAITEDCPPPPEFHSLKSQGLDDDDEGDEEFGDNEFEEDDDEGIIIVGEDESDVDDMKSMRNSDYEKFAAR